MVKLVLKLACVAVLAVGVFATRTAPAAAECGACIYMNDGSRTCQHCGHLGLEDCEPGEDRCTSNGIPCDADPSGHIACIR